MIGIYKITSPTKKVYIGQSIDIEKRFYQYQKLNCRVQIKLYSSLLKHGVEKHKFEILCECDISELNEKERYYQDVYCVLNKGGLNCRLTNSSDTSGVFSEETKMRMRISQIGNKNALGKKRSDETKAKMSNSVIGKKHSLETRKKMSLSSKGKNLGRIKSNEERQKLSDANKGKKLSEEHKAKISLALKGKKQSADMASKRKGRKHTEESKIKMSLWQKGRKLSDEEKEKRNKSRKKISLETRAKMSESAKKRRKNK